MNRTFSVLGLPLFLFVFVSVLARPQTVKKDQSSTRDDNVVQAIFIRKPKPEQPSDYRGPKLNVTIVLKAIFTSSGKVTDIKLTKVIPEETSKKLSRELVKRCINAAKMIKFQPATKDGRRVSMYMQLEYIFDLEQ